MKYCLGSMAEASCEGFDIFSLSLAFQTAPARTAL